jgi:precorrin-2/cobalt-factor-2 C20-methyltransferase
MTDGPQLVGVGVGPGDPGLVTVAAVEALRGADVVIVPVSAVSAVSAQPHGDVGAEAAGRAEQVVRAHLGQGRVLRVPFVMTGRSGVTHQRSQAWENAAQVVLDTFEAGATTVAFATLGDPNVYSTFTYLAATVRDRSPQVRVRTIPGITAMQDLAARAGIVLCEGRETLTLVPGTAGVDVLEASLRHDGTVAVYKGGDGAGELLEVLRRNGRLDEAVVGTRLGMDGERVGPAVTWAPARAVTGEEDAVRMPYLSTVLAPARRERHGGKL